MTNCSSTNRQAPATAELDFEALVDQFYQDLYQFGFSLSGNASDAADLTQETYRVLLLKAGQIRDPQKIKSWLFTTLYRQFLKGRRHFNRFPKIDLESAESELPVIQPRQVDQLDATQVLAALQSLEEKFRAPVALFYLEQLSYKEIAEVLAVPIGTVMSRLSRGKALLREQLSAAWTLNHNAGAASTTDEPATSRTSKIAVSAGEPTEFDLPIVGRPVFALSAA